MFYVDGDNSYHRTELYPYAAFAIAAFQAGNLMLVARFRAQLGRKGVLVFSICVLAVLAACAAQAFIYGLNLVVLASAAGALLLFYEAQANAAHGTTVQEERLSRLQRELSNARLGTATSQIEPHFMGNTLSAIRYLCQSDPNEAVRAVDLLAEHMQSLTSAFGSEECVPVTVELDHARDYLELRRVSSPDRMRFQIDVQASSFEVPPLSVLTLVENAVEHGVAPKRGGGVISIATRADAERFMVEVSDDGVGFDTSAEQENGRAHVGLANTRLRVEQMCGGKLTIESSPGKGTRAVISIPKESRQFGR